MAAGPIATGIRPGDRVGLMAPTSLEWAICVFAIGALATFRPTILLTVPRMLEKVAAAARQQAEAEGHRRLFAAAEATAVAWSRAGRAGPWLGHALLGRPVYARLRHALGGQVAWVISGGAPQQRGQAGRRDHR